MDDPENRKRFGEKMEGYRERTNLTVTYEDGQSGLATLTVNRIL